MRKSVLLLFFIFSVSMLSAKENVVALWKQTPNMKGEKSKLYLFEPADSVRKDVAVIICPGGSYAHLYGIKWEGFEVAQWLNENGITAFVLKYRVGKNGYHHPAMLEDVQRAIQWTRERAEDFHINPEKIGVMGFSAGGHLSLMAGAFYTENHLKKKGIDDEISLRPNFIAPVYPVVSMQDDIAHERSRKNLLGKNFGQAEKDKFSMELQIVEDFPPVFLVTTKDDPVVDCRNSVILKQSLEEKNVTHQFLLYENGGHGFGMSEKRGGEAAQWREYFKEWLYEIGILE